MAFSLNLPIRYTFYNQSSLYRIRNWSRAYISSSISSLSLTHSLTYSLTLHLISVFEKVRRAHFKLYDWSWYTSSNVDFKIEYLECNLYLFIRINFILFRKQWYGSLLLFQVSFDPLFWKTNLNAQKWMIKWYFLNYNLIYFLYSLAYCRITLLYSSTH